MFLICTNVCMRISFCMVWLCVFFGVLHESFRWTKRPPAKIFGGRSPFTLPLSLLRMRTSGLSKLCLRTQSSPRSFRSGVYHNITAMCVAKECEWTDRESVDFWSRFFASVPFATGLRRMRGQEDAWLGRVSEECMDGPAWGEMHRVMGGQWFDLTETFIWWVTSSSASSRQSSTDIEIFWLRWQWFPGGAVSPLWKQFSWRHYGF